MIYGMHLNQHKNQKMNCCCSFIENTVVHYDKIEDCKNNRQHLWLCVIDFIPVLNVLH